MRRDVSLSLHPATAKGLTLEIHQGDIAAQLVLAWQGRETLEILDEQGRAFLRFSPKGAEADVDNPRWHETLNPGYGARVSAQVREGAAPRWKVIQREPAFGWFDPRMNTEPLVVPETVKAFDEPVPFATWRIPARLGGKPLELSGEFLYQPPPRGEVRTLLDKTVLPAGLRVTVSNSAVPAVFLSNTSKELAAVLDAQGRPYLKIGPDGVWADTASLAWRLATGEPPGQGWTKLSPHPSHAWPEPRAAWRKPVPRGQAAGEIGRWEIPLSLGSQRLAICGSHQWLPTPPKPAR